MDNSQEGQRRNSTLDTNSETGVSLVNTLIKGVDNNMANNSTTTTATNNMTGGVPIFQRRVSLTANIIGRARDWITGNMNTGTNNDNQNTFEVGSYQQRSASIIPDDINIFEVARRRSRSRSLGSEADLADDQRNMIIPGPIF